MDLYEQLFKQVLQRARPIIAELLDGEPTASSYADMVPLEEQPPTRSRQEPSQSSQDAAASLAMSWKPSVREREVQQLDSRFEALGNTFKIVRTLLHNRSISISQFSLGIVEALVTAMRLLLRSLIEGREIHHFEHPKTRKTDEHESALMWAEARIFGGTLTFQEDGLHVLPLLHPTFVVPSDEISDHFYTEDALYFQRPLPTASNWVSHNDVKDMNDPQFAELKAWIYEKIASRT